MVKNKGGVMSKKMAVQKFTVEWDESPNDSITVSNSGNKNTTKWFMLSETLVAGYLDDGDKLDEVEILEAIICELAFKK